MPPFLVQLLLVGGGGFLGSIARYLTVNAVNALALRQGRATGFPYGTIVVNLAGCAMIGALAAASERHGPWSAHARLLLFTGILGGFTTFSAFGLETFSLLQEGRWPLAVLNVLLQLGAGLTAVWGGYHLVMAR